MSKRKWGEVINPSDKTHICIDDPAAAAVATLIIGGGKMGLVGPDGDQLLPLFFFGADEETLEQHFRKKFGCGWKDISVERIVAAAHTAAYGSVEEIESMEEAWATLPPEAAEKARAAYTDKKRSSLNRIVDAFHALKKKEGA